MTSHCLIQITKEERERKGRKFESLAAKAESTSHNENYNKEAIKKCKYIE